MILRRAPGDRDRPACLTTVVDRSDRWPVTGVGNAWSRRCFDGPFYLFAAPPDRPAVSLVFVQSADGNTGARNPEDLGGGATDKYLIYEGLSRVAADGVLAGASSIGQSALFTVTHPELCALRAELGLPPHLIQMVISNDGNFDLGARIFATPEIPVLLLAGERCIAQVASGVARRPWITLVPINNDLGGTFVRLRHEHGIARISAVGGRVTATNLVDAGLVQDIYLTTSAIHAGEPDTPWYVGDRRPSLETIVTKSELTDRVPIRFDHLAIQQAANPS
jgi:riboflavin biosynthesis pyrimidine reductase